MQCDVCGRKIVGKPYRVIIEGAKVITCVECAKLGSGYWTPEGETRLRRGPSSLPRSIKSTASNKHLSQQVSQVDFEIIEGFGSVIKRSREKLGLTHEDLGRIIGEKESVIKKIESEKIAPDARLAVKLERALKIKLLVKQEADLNRPVDTSIKGKRSVTLGEIVRIKGEERGGDRLGLGQ